MAKKLHNKKPVGARDAYDHRDNENISVGEENFLSGVEADENSPEARKVMAQLSEMAGDPDKWNNYCYDFAKAHENEKEPTVEEHNKLSFYDAQMQIMHEYMTRRMKLQCLTPLLQRGAPGRIRQALGSYLAFVAVSKFFDKHDGTDKSRKPGNEKSKTPKKSDGKKDSQMSRPWTPDKAAVQRVAFISSTYYAMRQPGADVRALQLAFEQASNSLYMAAGKDGCSKEDIDKSTRELVGKLIEDNPEVAAWFGETAYGGVSMDPAHEVMSIEKDKDGRVVMNESTEWTGEFSTRDGKPYEGGFSPRLPMTFNMHMNSLQGLCWENIKDAKSLEELNRAVSGFESGRIFKFGVGARMMLDDGYSLGDTASMAQDAMLPMLCKKDSEWMAEGNGLRVADILSADAVGQSKYKSYFNRWAESVGIDERYEMPLRLRPMPSLPSGVDVEQTSRSADMPDCVTDAVDIRDARAVDDAELQSVLDECRSRGSVHMTEDMLDREVERILNDMSDDIYGDSRMSGKSKSRIDFDVEDALATARRYREQRGSESSRNGRFDGETDAPDMDDDDVSYSC